MKHFDYFLKQAQTELKDLKAQNSMLKKQLLHVQSSQDNNKDTSASAKYKK